jgi:predicted nucleic-acid-binding protein
VIGLDTDILVRYIMQDDPAQAATASLLLEALTPEAPGFVPILVVVELGWVLADCLIERGAASAGCERTLTFDRGAAKTCGMQLAG